MRSFLVTVAAGLALGMPGLASAQSFTGAEQIMSGDLTAAERQIEDARELFPYNPDLLLNLAVVYARTHRMDQARGLYREVLARPDEVMSLSDGRVASAHKVAAAGLQRLEMRTVALR